ncbi:glycoside hydrolase family 88 protein [Bacteroides ovatus]|uniref:glycoside hydrolase family 88/105 protein n=1 Tax=Bacteroides ovatus TaxID=28116 RepID=UPI00233004C1|nr:glycoside hydrolase family 88 protein [Bacteroides ovatus]MDC2739389.1 glycoside hydrolase family 88 protein [Bacteroides ovatus]
MKKYGIIGIVFVGVTVICAFTFRGHKEADYLLTDFPAEADPVTVGNKIADRFLEQWHSQYGSPLRVDEPRTQITYPDVCTWLGGLWFAQATKNRGLEERLEARFQPLFTTEAYLQPQANHVDNNVFGAVPLELYMQTKDEKYLAMGMKYADTQWDAPATQELTEEEKAWADKGYSWQTRLWMDDMFMITAVQAQAYRVTQDMKYITRAAREMVVYLDSLQLDNGLFYHAPSAPYCWGRANGWMAVGMAELLRILPETNPDYAEIMAAYLKMMKTLKETQNEKGMWRQLVDDPELWEETSGSAMFTYAMIVGVKKGWLDAKEYGEVARKGWIALCSYIDKAGDVKAVCEGTMIKNSREHYINRLALTGDLHGQAPVLWCAYALVTDFKTNK